jgi:vancomycin resistance protein YoaR
MLCLLLLVQPNTIPDTFTVIDNGEPITVIKRTGMSMALPGFAIIDPEKYSNLLDQIDHQVKKEPVNAKLDDFGRIVPEEVGYQLNRHSFTEQFFHFFYDNGPSRLEVPKIYIYPKVDSEVLSIIRAKRIGQYVTFYNSNNKARSTNIALAVNAINNHVVFPGESFSFNKVVGKRTVEKGYMKAPEIVKGEMIEGIGGGICQVSSTLFNAVDSSGVKIVERYSHSKKVPYVPPGRDATVSWYGPDFTFLNNYNQPILIRAKASHGRVIIMLFSSEAINFTPKAVPYAATEKPLLTFN